MGKPRELFETELAEIREELLRLGVRPSESLQQSSAIQTEPLENWQQARRHWLDRMQSEMALFGEARRQARLKEDSDGFRAPPKNWERAVIRLAEARLSHYHKLIEKLKKTD